MNLNRKTIIELASALLVVLLVSVLGFVGYNYYISGSEENNDDTPVVEKQNCEELTMVSPDGLSAPAAPVLESVLNKNSKSDVDICEWTVNGVKSHASFPAKGKCIFGDQLFSTAGKYSIELTVKDNDCKLSKEVTVK